MNVVELELELEIEVVLWLWLWYLLTAVTDSKCLRLEPGSVAVPR